ncbi:MAG TPA: hypothetical protein VGL71_01355, partial [Urbifossiella sp.]
LQNDECLFVQPSYTPTARNFKIRMYHHDIPLMLMSYLGTTKTLLNTPVVKLAKPSVWSLRLPALITGAVTIWMFGLLLFRIGGAFAAIAGSFLLAIDPIFLLTSVFDWGPVALQHFLLVAGVLAVHRFYHTGSRLMLAAGFFSFGLGMWDKALFSWMLTGLVIASLLFLARQIWKRMTVSNVLIAATGFVLGAAPLLVYNVHENFETFRGNAKMAPEEIWQKTLHLHHTLDGSGLFGYIVREENDGPPRPPQNALENTSAFIRKIAGVRRQGWLPELLVLALLCVPFWISRWKVVGFALITGTVAWLLMAATKDAGGSVHHVVLLWPVPQFLVAFCLGTAIAKRASVWRWVAVSLVALVCFQNALVINQYLYNFARYGPGMSWTDAIFPLKDALVRLHPEHVNLMDWGMEFNTLALTQGELELRWASEPGDREVPNENDQRLIGIFLESAPQSVWVRHVDPIELTTGSSGRFEKRAAERGYRKDQLEIIHDRNGRDVFEVYRFVKVNP